MTPVPLSDIPFESLDTIVLDLDGTLYNKRGFVARVIMGSLLRLHILVPERLTRRMFKGRYYGSEEAYLNAFFRGMGKWPTVSAGHARKWYFGEYMPLQERILRCHFHKEQWIEDILLTCRKKGIRVALLSDYDAAREKVVALGYDPSFFDYIVSSSQLGGLKPCGESMRKLIEMTGARPERSLVIGDKRKADGRAAERVGAMFRCCK